MRKWHSRTCTAESLRACPQRPTRLALQRDFALARLDSNGNLHPAFNGTGRLKTDFAGGLDGAYALALQPDNKLIAAGEANVSGARGFALARYNLLGALDETFGSAGLQWVDPSPHRLAIALSLALQPDGKPVAAGVGIGANQDFAVRTAAGGPAGRGSPSTLIAGGKASAMGSCW